jgi:hypothetical protein
MSADCRSRFGSFVRYAGFAASLLVIVGLVSVGGCKRRKIQGPVSVPSTPEEIQEMVSNLKTKRRVGFIEDIRVPSAEKLGEIGPSVKEYGAIPALEKMAADKDPAVKAVAEQALQKIKGQ